MITAERLRELMHYEPATGLFIWLVSFNKRICIGNIAGNLGNHGYCVIVFDKLPYLAHRLAWLYMTGEWPDTEIDHINGDKTDNRLANLRLATRSGNESNKRVQTNNTSGFKGVNWRKVSGEWRARIQVNGKRIHLGYFDTPHRAYANYCVAARLYFGEFARCYEDDQLIIPRKVFEERVLRNLLKATQPPFYSSVG